MNYFNLITKRIVIAITLLPLVGFLPHNAAAAETSLFFGGFETNNFSEWGSPVGNNFSLSGGTCRLGPDSDLYAVKITGANTPHDQILQRSVSTVGYDHINLSFCYKWDVLESGDKAVIEYTADGTTWQPIKTIDNTTEDHMMYAADDTKIASSVGVGLIPVPYPTTLDQLASHNLSLPANAANNPLFALRVREHLTDSDDYIWMDDFRINGTVLSTSTPTSTPTSSFNLISNPSLETASANPNLPLGWAKGGWGTNNSVFSYPVAGIDGAKAARIDVSQYTDGDAKWYFNDVPVTSGQTYTFSDQYLSNVDGTIMVRYQMASGTYVFAKLGFVPPAASWQTFQTNFVVPSGVVALSIFHEIKAVGFLMVDNYSLLPATNSDQFSNGMVTLSFDDGWSSVYANAIPILNTAGLKSTQYIITSDVGLPDRVTQGNILAMQASGHEIEAHTKTHPSLISLSPADLQTEIGGSRRDLVSLGILPNANSLAYPFGDFNGGVEAATKNSGFLAGRSTDAGLNTKSTDHYALKSYVVTPTSTFTYVQGLIDAARVNKNWLIITFHQIDSSGAAYSITPELLQQIVNYLQQNSVPVVTVSQGLAQMNPATLPSPDTTVPSIVLNGSSTISLHTDDTYVESGAKAVDNVDGDISSAVSVSGGPVLTTASGSYTLRYNVSDLAGNPANEVTRLVNVLAASSSTPTSSLNLILNPSLETSSANPNLPLGWSQGGWGTNTRVFTYPVAGTDGTKAARIDVSQYTSGDAKWYFQPVSVTPGATYQFSDSYLSDIPSYIAAQVKLADGTFTYPDIGQVPASAGNWQTFQNTFTVPANASSVTIFHLIKQVGSLSVDKYSLSLQSSSSVPTSNLIINPSAETVSASSSSLPQAWQTGRWGNNSTTFTYPAPGIAGSSAMKIDMTSRTTGDAKWYFNDVAVNGSSSYVFSDRYISTVPTEPTIRFKLANGTYQYKYLNQLPAAAVPTQATYTFVTPSSTVAVTVFHLIAKVGSLTVDDFSLTPAP